MKKMGIVLTGVMLVALLGGVGWAQGSISGAGWWSGEQVQNVGDEQATVVITAYDKDSTATYEETKLVDSGDAYTFTPFTDFATMPDGFMGSAVVSSDQPIKAIVNVTNLKAGSFGETGGRAAAQYQGFDGSVVDTSLLFPIAKGDYYGSTTTHYVQNAGSVATTFVATFTMRTSASYVYNSPSIDPGQMVVFSVYDASYTPPGVSGDDGRVGSLVVSSSQPLAGVSMEHKTVQSPATVLQGTRSFASADYASKAYAPVVKHQWYGRFTGVQVQNVALTSPITVVVTYTGVDGACEGNEYTEEAGIGGGEAYSFVQYEGMTPLEAPCSAAATITGTGDFVAVVNEVNLPGYPTAGITYSAIPGTAPTQKISLPLFKDDYYQSTSGLQIQNVGVTTATNVVATFQCSVIGGSTFTAISEAQEAGPGGAVLFFTPSQTPTMFTTGNPFSSGDSTCSVIVTSDQPVVAIVNEMGWGQKLDDNNYEGFNLTP